MFDTLRDDVVYMIVCQGIIDRFAFTAVFDQFGVFQETELMGDG